MISLNDIGVSLGMNAILYYVIIVLGDIKDHHICLDKIYFVDIVVSVIALGMYVKVIEQKNEQNVTRAHTLNEKAYKESRLLNIKAKPIQTDIIYPDRNMIMMLALSPYYIFF